MAVSEFKLLRRINAVLYLIISTAIIGLVMAASVYFNDVNIGYFVIGTISGLSAIIATFALWRNKMKLGLITAGLSALCLSIPTYHFIVPGLKQLRTTDQLTAFLQTNGIALPRNGGPHIVSPDFTEPSLVYHLGTKIDVSGKTDLLNMEALKTGTIIILDNLKEKAAPKLAMIKIQAEEQSICISTSDAVKSINYSKGDKVELTITRAVPCPIPTALTSETLDE